MIGIMLSNNLMNNKVLSLMSNLGHSIRGENSGWVEQTWFRGGVLKYQVESITFYPRERENICRMVSL
jgi:hypothetical protein